MPRFLALATASAVAAATLLTAPAGNAVAVTGSTTDATERAAARTVKTPFALKASGYGTRVTGGQLPVTSDTTAYQVIGCTNKAPISRGNDVAAIELPGLGVIEGVRTRNNTYTNRTKRKTTVVSRHDVARVQLGPLVLRGVSSKAMAWHDKEGFHRKVVTNVVGIDLAGEPVEVPVDQQVLEIPGVARITFGVDRGSVSRNGARAIAKALRVDLIPSGTVVRIGHSSAHIYRGLDVGQFRGQAFGTRVRALDDNVRSGPQPLSYMPCQGTFGEVKDKVVAGVEPAEELAVSGVRNEVMGKTIGKGDKRRATGYLESRIARVTLGPLTVNAIKGRVNVTRFVGGRLLRNVKGTTLGEIVVDGEPRAIPDPGQSLDIPGVAKLEANVVTKVKNGIKVTALRLTLLDGTGAVVELGNAELRIKSSGARAR